MHCLFTDEYWKAHAFWKHFLEKLEACGMSQSDLDQCFFIVDKIICFSYVDDLLFWSKDNAWHSSPDIVNAVNCAACYMF